MNHAPLFMFAGTYTALVTPFRDDLLDEPAFEKLIEQQVAAGIDGIVPVGTTGESPTLDHEEHARVIELAVKAARGRCKVIAGTGSNATSEAVSLTLEAERLGADAALLVAPYYNKPSQEGLFQHYRAIASASKLPLILYSIPGRCGIEIAVETVARLAQECPTVVAIKEAGGTVERVSALRAVLPDAFEILSGDDSLTLPFISAGAVGVISVASNRIPAEVGALVKAALRGDYAEAQRLHRKFYTLFKDLFVEPNPVPIKYAMSRTGLMTGDVRLPLCAMSEGNRARLDKVLGALDLLS
jgi:4-hydroxy-tetrahydrodipicolinate synthase